MKYFRHSEIRPNQLELIEKIVYCLNNKKNFIVHAPTGLGKTDAVTSPALEFALENNLTVFFVTHRKTQHKIVIDVLKDMKNKFNLDFTAADIIGRQSMCTIHGAGSLSPSEFDDYCKKEIENLKCKFYNNTKQNNKLTTNAKIILEELSRMGPYHSEIVHKKCLDEKLCPYEISTALASNARVIVTDYFYLFNPYIREIFLKKIEKDLNNSIIIIDEAHNLGERVRKLQIQRLSNSTLNEALLEAKRFGYDKIYSKIADYIECIYNILSSYNEKLKKEGKSEILVTKNDFINKINEIKNYDELIADFQYIGDSIKEIEKKSHIGSIADFLLEWKGSDEGFTRIFSKSKKGSESSFALSYRCLDPSLLIKPVIDASYCTIAISGTLTPVNMYRDLYGFNLENTIEEEMTSPYPKENKLNIIVTEATTKFKKRNDEEFKKMAKICSEMVDIVPGNCAIYFPSYELMENVFEHYHNLNNEKVVFKEKTRLTKKERVEFLEKFKSYKNGGAVLFGVVGGSFSEGVDFPENLLKCIIIAGLPLSKPDLETNQLIKYYDKKFNEKGWDYGYALPAFNKAFQAAGRCIRSEKDIGVIVFLDERYASNNYIKYFPKNEIPKVSKNYKSDIKEFFDKFNKYNK